MFVPVWFTHAWSTGEGDLLGAYLHCTATTPFETVCKQFINGSVPFGYSLNSGFDTGNDSWFSSGAWQVGTPVQKMPAGTGALWVGESRGTQRSRLPSPVGSGSLRRKIPLPSSEAEEENETFTGSGATVFLLQQLRRAPSHVHINTQCHDLHGRMEQVSSILVTPYSQLMQGLPHQWPWQSFTTYKKRRHVIHPLIKLFNWKCL